jgi:hypothetical protein
MTIQSTSLAWSKANLTSLADAPPSLQPRPYIRSDGVSSVVSYSSNLRIFELALEGGNWHHYDLLSNSAGSPVEGHTPFPYVRSDGVSAVVYLSPVGTGIMEIHELTLVNGSWQHHNLSAVTGTPVSVGGTFQGYIRGDRVTSVIYRGEGHRIHELALEGGTTWTHYDLTAVTGAPTGPELGADGSLHAFARSDGATSVVYCRSDGEVRQLRLGTNGIWESQTLTSDGGEPKAAGYGLVGYVRTDGVNAIVYRGTDEHIYELTLVNGQFDELNDLSAITGAAPAQGFVYGYNRGDGISTVIYQGPDFHIHELALEGGTTWTHYDLTAVTGSKPGFQPIGYVRSDGATAIVYYDTDGQVRQLKLS